MVTSTVREKVGYTDKPVLKFLQIAIRYNSTYFGKIGFIHKVYFHRV